MRSRLSLLILCLIAMPLTANAEGTWQLGPNQDFHPFMKFQVDIIKAGEVINIAAGINTDDYPKPLLVHVKDPAGKHVSGSPFSIQLNSKGWLAGHGKLPPAIITNPIKVTTTVVGAHTVTFDNKNLTWIDPLDITVTPNASAPVKPGSPVGGYGRLFAARWSVKGPDFTDKTNPNYYVMVPTGTKTDYTWLMQFNGLAARDYDVIANANGLNPPNAGFSEVMNKVTPPLGQYRIYLNPPKLAKGGTTKPTLTGVNIKGCGSSPGSVLAGQKLTINFTSSASATYRVIIDTNKDGKYDASSDPFIVGTAVAGSNSATWDGKNQQGKVVGAGSYKVRLQLRVGEFHFVAADVETLNPGLRIFSVDPPGPGTSPASTSMFWNDSRVNNTSLKIVPGSSLPAGRSSGLFSVAARCSKSGVNKPNAHCWGNFTANTLLSPGDNNYIDTWVYAYASSTVLTLNILDGAKDNDGDKLSNAAECGKYKTDPNKKDTDGDGLDDGTEVLGNNPTNPLIKDTDGDGLWDGIEDTNKNGQVDVGETDPNKKDTDGDGLHDGIEDANKNGKKEAGETDPLKQDTDGDGINDGVEDKNKNGKMDVGETDPLNKDTDGDGLHDGIEDADKNGKKDATETDPLKKDTDGDGLSDGLEDTDKDGTKDAGETDPRKKDTDGDGLNDGVEDKNKNGKKDATETDPRKWDTDGGCEGDGTEVAKGKNPLNPSDDVCAGTDTDGDGIPDIKEDKNGNGKLDPGETDPKKKDTDGDGLDDGVEDKNKNGQKDPGETDPSVKDTDGDGLHDGVEDKNKNGKKDPGETDPLKKDTDGDGLSDGIEDKNKNGVKDPGETDPLNKDTDGDGLNDGIEDSNKDGKKDANETDPLKKDTDGDGIGDGIEDSNKNGQKDPGETDPLKKDTDGDGLGDGVEDKNKNGKKDPGETDPRQKDTDKGGVDDGTEVNRGTNPLDPKDDNTTPGPDAGSGKLDAGADNGAGSPDSGVGNDGATIPPGVYMYGGAGCALSSGGQDLTGAVPLLFPLALLLWARTRRNWRSLQRSSVSKRNGFSLLALLALLLLSAPASAQAPQLSTITFRPTAATGMNYYVTEDARTLGHLIPSAGLLVSYAHKPLVLYDTATNEVWRELVSWQLNMDIMAAIGFWDRVELGLALPVTLTQDGDDLNVIGAPAGTSVGTGIGDLRVIPKVRLFTASVFSMGVALPVSFPTASDGNLLGDRTVTFTPKLALAVNTRYIDASLNAGYRVRGASSTTITPQQGLVIVDDEVVASLGVKVHLWKDKIDFIADAYMSMAVEEQNKEEIPAEVLGGLRFFLPYGLVANVGAGPGLTRGIATPVFRAFAGLGWQMPEDPEPVAPVDGDRDKDGILDSKDKCPDDPEDKDGFEDEDGCPDKDNDKDGILDGDDKCPLEPEDIDTFEDKDGCPDTDNDKDGILDSKDKCPLKPEDKDNFQDEDGCPDPDNDSDGILDGVDKCPLKPEAFNGFEDEDGCPDMAPKAKVQITPNKITVPPVYFDTNKDTIKTRSFTTLNQVADLLSKNMWVKKVRVEGHTDGQGDEEYNLDLSQRRAASVMRYLEESGISSDRMTSEGYGETQPIATNRTNKGRGKNRRVEFLIIDPKLGSE